MKRIALLFALSFALLSGCGSSIKVSGTVTFEDGTPLKIGTVVFDSGSTSARGQLNDKGQYTLESKGTKDGIPGGHYKVTVMGAVEEFYVTDPSGTRRDTKMLIDSKYQSPEKSGLTCEVSGPTTYDFKVTPPDAP